MDLFMPEYGVSENDPENIDLPLLDDFGISVVEDELPAAITTCQDYGFRTNVPTATCVLPSVSILVGDYNFTALITPDTVGSDCLYSADLNKIFVNVNKNVPVQFQLSPCDLHLYIRALPVYVNSNEYHVVVERCLAHVAADKREGKDVDVVAHILRCTSTNAAVYYTDENSGRFSVCVPVQAPQCGKGSFTVSYKFTCLNSCREGNSKRVMGVIFTLENEIGEVLGRQFMNVRVCSCPKRDKEKEERKNKEEETGKTTERPCKTTKGQEPPKKFIKKEPGEPDFVEIPIRESEYKELAKFASTLIYSSLGEEQRLPTEVEISLLSKNKSIIESS